MEYRVVDNQRLNKVKEKKRKGYKNVFLSVAVFFFEMKFKLITTY